MRNRRFVSLWVLALLLPVTLGLACVKRDWSICAPDDKQPCLPGYVCTPNLLCVRATDGVAAADGKLLKGRLPAIEELMEIFRKLTQHTTKE